MATASIEAGNEASEGMRVRLSRKEQKLAKKLAKKQGKAEGMRRTLEAKQQGTAEEVKASQPEAPQGDLPP